MLSLTSHAVYFSNKASAVLSSRYFDHRGIRAAGREPKSALSIRPLLS